MGPGELILGFLALDALKPKPAPKAPPPPPPDTGGGGGGGLDAGKIGSLAGTAVGGIVSLLGGSGGVGTGITTTASVAAPTATTTATAAAETAAVALPSGFVLSVGSVFTLAWAALFVLQFIVINALGNARIAWLRYRNGVYDLVRRPHAHLHNLERSLVDQALRELGLNAQVRDADEFSNLSLTSYGISFRDPAPDGPGTDPRLDAFALSASDGIQVGVQSKYHRQIYSNPFTGQPQAAQKWRLLQLAARLVASRYVFDLARLAAGMARSFPGLGGKSLTEPNALEYWNYPLLGGGLPDKTYAGVLDELRAAAVISPTVDDVLNAARLAAILHVASTVQQDPDVHFPWDPVAYATLLYNAMGLGLPQYHVRMGEGAHAASWEFDPVFYNVPVKQLWLDLDWLKAGLHLQPFKPELAAVGVLEPESFSVTALRVVKA